jgi:serine/threonine-protein kinase RsbW
VPEILVSGDKDFMQDHGRSGSLEVVIPSDPVEARRVQEHIEQLLMTHAYSERDIFGAKLALEEALVNAIKHGNQMDRSKKVSLSYRVCSEWFEVVITDEGPGFNPDDVPDPVAFENLERPCGRGLLLMRHYMTHVIFHPPGNKVFMRMERQATNTNGRP